MFGAILKKKREELAMTLQEVSQMTGMSPKQISSLENDRLEYFVGGIKEIELLTKLYARKLNVTVDAELLEQLKKTEPASRVKSAEVEIPLFLLVSPKKKKVRVLT
jgi:transcriptional regulator with XRE-family HTH domain